ncbi:unnamed protein product [Prorocentrum cordatum]|uniref:Uncharacterized protein n=1 Tax=Prorocentrum cordatum TaxID=2364126 RepID=A0ABN9SJJ4_9DINO|nr:unnamed protein product [Polarella glacialis]
MMRSVSLIALLIIVPRVSASINVKGGEGACASEDLKNRARLQNKLAGVCESMCREVQAYPACSCPNFVEPDSTPGVMTWDELLTHMDQLGDWGRDTIKAWHKQASQLQTARGGGSKNGTIGSDAAVAPSSAKRTCTVTVVPPASVSLQAGGMPHMVHDDVDFCGAGQLKVVEGSCPDQAAFDNATGVLKSNGGASECQHFQCDHYPCCMAFKCGDPSGAWAR